MRKILLIFLFLFFGCNSSNYEEKDGFYNEYYPSGNKESSTIYVDGNISGITLYYDNSSNSMKRDIFSNSTLFYNPDGKLAGLRSFYLNGNVKSYEKLDKDGEVIASLSWDSSNNNMWGYDKTNNFIKMKPRRMKTDDYWNDYCKKDKENSNHSWDQFFDSKGKLVWRCRGWDNGQFVKNCNCKLWVKKDSRWPDKTNNIP